MIEFIHATHTKPNQHEKDVKESSHKARDHDEKRKLI